MANPEVADDAPFSGARGAVGMVGLHPRHDVLADDARRIAIGQCAFEPVADLDAHLVILHEN